MPKFSYDDANAGKADFEWTYNRLDPRAYFDVLSALDYAIPERAAPALSHCDLIISTGVVGYITERIIACRAEPSLRWRSGRSRSRPRSRPAAPASRAPAGAR